MEHLETTYGHLQLEQQNIINILLIPVHVIPLLIYEYLHLLGKITSASQELMVRGVEILSSHFTLTTLYGMDRTVSPAAHVAHNIILHILLSNSHPQPLMTLRPGSV